MRLDRAQRIVKQCQRSVRSRIRALICHRRTVASIRRMHLLYWGVALLGACAAFGGEYLQTIRAERKACAANKSASRPTAGPDATTNERCERPLPRMLWEAKPITVGKALVLLIAVVFCRTIHGLVVASLFVPRVTRRTPLNPSPDMLVTLVHGTFAPGAKWTNDEAYLPRQLTGQPDRACTMFVLDWSGENNHLARHRAAGVLRRHLIAKERLYPGVPHFLIAHSHGGNVAMYAANSGPRIAGLVTLSTPFIQSREREQVDVPWLGTTTPLLLLTSAASAIPTWLIYSLSKMLGAPVESVPFTLIILLVFMAIMYPITRWWRTASYRLPAQLEFGSVDHTRCFVVRTPGDEAGAVLMMLPLASTIIHIASRTVVSMGKAPLRLSAFLRSRYHLLQNFRRRAAWLLGFMSAVTGMLVMLDLAWMEEPVWWQQLLPIALVGTFGLAGLRRLKVASIRWWGRTLTVIVASVTIVLLGQPYLGDIDEPVTLLDMLIVGLATAVLLIVPYLLTTSAVYVGKVSQALAAAVANIVAALAVLPFGIDMAPATARFDLTAENTPEGDWRVRSANVRSQRDTPRSHSATVAPIDEPLMHSRAYSDPAVCRDVMQFVKASCNRWSRERQPDPLSPHAAIVEVADDEWSVRTPAVR